MQKFFRKLTQHRFMPVVFVAAIVLFAPFSFMYLKDKLISNWREDSKEAFMPELFDADYYESGTFYSERVIDFGDGSLFTIYRFQFGDDSIKAKTYVKEIDIEGDDITIRWQNYDASPPKWEKSLTVDDTPKATLFIETTGENIIASIPALYYNSFSHKTIESIPNLEKPVAIKKNDGGYTIRWEFNPIEDTVGEAWFYKSKSAITNWSLANEKILLSQDLHKNRRFCLDGYYFKTYTTYEPYTENGFFRNPANFTGAHLVRNESLGNIRRLGYAMSKICAQNQNSYGFWETGPLSQWLFSDYGIEYDFYDTRFSTDFARSLITGYTAFGDREFLARAKDYAAFLIKFGKDYGYWVGENAVLVPDYWGETQTKKTHVSLNHQLAELNFLLELFMVTGDTMYYDTAHKMLKGVEFTETQWVMEDGNLNYAILYEDSVNTMVDYPFLTYNDMYETKELLSKLGEESPALERLMATKKAWMDNNGITEYKGYKREE